MREVKFKPPVFGNNNNKGEHELMCFVFIYFYEETNKGRI
jgi:hypothetical protein